MIRQSNKNIKAMIITVCAAVSMAVPAALCAPADDPVGQESYGAVVAKNLELTNQLSQLNKKYKDLEDKYNAVQAKAETEKQEMSKGKYALDFKRTEDEKKIGALNKELDDERQAKANAAAPLLKSIQDKETEISSLNAKLAEKDKDISGLKDSLGGAKSEIEKLTGQAAAAQDQLENSTSSLEEKITGLTKDLTDERKQRSDAERSYARSIQENEAEIDSLNAKLAEKDKDISGLKDSLGGAKSEIEKLTGQAAAAQDQLKNSASRIAAMQQKIDERDKEELTYIEDVQVLKSQLETKEKAIQSGKTALAGLTAQKKSGDEKMAELDAYIKGVQSAAIDIENAIAGFKKETETPLAIERENKTAETALEKEKQKLTSEIAALKKEAVAAAEKLDKLSAESEAAKKELIALQETKKTSEDQVAAKEEGIKTDSAQLKDTSAAAKSVEDLRTKMSEFDAVITDYQGRLDELKAEWTQVTAEKEASEKELKARADALKQVKDAAKKQTDTAVVEKLQETVNALNQKYKEIDARRSGLESELSGAETKRKEAEAAFKEGENFVAAQNAMIQKVDSDTKQVAELKKSIEDAVYRSAELKKKIDSLKDQIASAAAAKKKTEGALKAKQTASNRVLAVLSFSSAKPESVQQKKSVIQSVVDLRQKLDVIYAWLRMQFAAFKEYKDKMQKQLEDNRNTILTSERAERLMREELQRSKDEMNKERLEMHYNLGVAYTKSGMYKDAEREYLKCLTIDKDDANTRYNLAILYDDKLNENQKALDQYEQFLILKPKGEDSEEVKRWMSNAEFEVRLGPVAK